MGRTSRNAKTVAADEPRCCFFTDTLRRARGELSGADYRLIERLKVAQSYRTGDEIFAQGGRCDGLYAVETGVVAIRKRDRDGHAMIVRLVHPGEPLGYRTYFARGAYTAAAEALRPSSVSFIDRTGIDELLVADVALARAFLFRLANDLKDAEDARLESGSSSVRVRLARLLVTLKDRFATMGEDGVLNIELPLGRRDIAAMLGARPETIARAIRALEDDGVAHFARRSVSVADVERLYAAAEPVTEP